MIMQVPRDRGDDRDGRPIFPTGEGRTETLGLAAGSPAVLVQRDGGVGDVDRAEDVGLDPLPQSRSSSGTCLSAAAWNTMSGRKSLMRRKMRVRSRTSARRPSIFALDCLAASISNTACRAGSEFSITSTRPAPKVTMRSQISAPMDPPPPVIRGAGRVQPDARGRGGRRGLHRDAYAG